MVGRAHSAGVLRSEVVVEDVMLLLIGIDGISATIADGSPEPLHRVVDLVVDGLCHTRTQPSGSPLDAEGLLAAARPRR